MAMRFGFMAFGMMVLVAALLLYSLPTPVPPAEENVYHSYTLHVLVPKLLAKGGIIIGLLMISMGALLPKGRPMPNAPYEPWRMAESVNAKMRSKVKEHMK
jgi:hypothetical protein